MSIKCLAVANASGVDGSLSSSSVGTGELGGAGLDGPCGAGVDSMVHVLCTASACTVTVGGGWANGLFCLSETVFGTLRFFPGEIERCRIFGAGCRDASSAPGRLGAVGALLAEAVFGAAGAGAGGWRADSMRSCFNRESRSFLVRGLKATQMGHLSDRCDSPRQRRQESCGSLTGIDRWQAAQGLKPAGPGISPHRSGRRGLTPLIP